MRRATYETETTANYRVVGVYVSLLFPVMVVRYRKVGHQVHLFFPVLKSKQTHPSVRSCFLYVCNLQRKLVLKQF